MLQVRRMSELSTVSSHHQNSEYDESFAEMIFLRWVGVRIKLRFLSFIFFVYEPSTYYGLSHIHTHSFSEGKREGSGQRLHSPPSQPHVWLCRPIV